MSRVDEALKRARAAGADLQQDERSQWGMAQAATATEWRLDRFPSEGRHLHAAADVSAAEPVEAENPRPIRYKSEGLAPEFSEKLVVGDQRGGASAEQYRRIAATLHRAQQTDQIKLVMVSSALPGEGKTLTAANVALTLSESYGRRVLLVDADLRCPALHHVFQVSNALGLVDELQAARATPLPLIEFSRLLSVLPAGKPQADPMRLLVSDSMRRALAEAAQTFDWVIVDTPPLGIVSDAHLLAEMVDRVVLVVRAAVTPYEQVTAAADRVGREKIVGVVLNQVAERDVTQAYERYGDAYKQDARG